MNIPRTTALRLALLSGLLSIFVVIVLQRHVLPRVEAAQPQGPAQTKMIELATGLDQPWGMAFLPDGGILITEKPGTLRRFSNGQLQAEHISGLPAIVQHGQGGLMDIALHPDFANNRWVYLSYAAADDTGVGTEVGRGKLEGNALSNWQTLFRLQPKTSKKQHFGARLVFDRDGYLFITLGDRGQRKRAQNLNDHAGSIIRLYDDGRIPRDNPFVDHDAARPEIYSYGHRNQQGAALHPQTGQLWTHEHGPQGGDELNAIQPGANYGWPLITYGKEYGSGFSIGEGTEKPGITPPLYHWVPSIAPSGMTFYSGNKFPDWQGNLLIGSLKFQMLVRLEMKGEHVIREHRLLKNRLGRIRDVRQGPDGYIYLLTDASEGKLVRLEPLDDAQSAIQKHSATSTLSLLENTEE